MQTKKVESVEQYIQQSPPERREILEKVREAIRKAAPNAEERIRWGMPTYWQVENLVHFANGKNHIGFYPAPEAIEHFAKELEDYKTSKGAIQFPLVKPIPYSLIAKITKYRVAMVEND